MDSVAVKKCSECGVSKPLTFEFFYARKNSKHGFRIDCKACCSARGKVHAAANAEVAKARAKAWYEANRDRAAARQKDYREANADEIAAYHKARYMANRDELKAQKKVYAAANAKKIAAQKRVYRKANPEKVAAAQKAWREANPEARAANHRNRRAFERAAEGTHTLVDIRNQLDSQVGRCYWCGSKLKKSGKGKFHVDHVIALCRGGGNGPNNLVCACPSCNLTKNKKTPLEFAGRLF